MKQRWELLGLPTLVFYLLIFTAAQGVFIYNSFFENAGVAQLGAGPTLKNYVSVLSDPFYLRAFQQTFLMSVMVLAGCLAVGVPMAYYLARSQSRAGYVVFTVLSVTSLTSIVIRGLGWISLLSSAGPINRLLVALGIVDKPMALTGNLTGAIIALTHALIPYMVLLLVPIIQAINPQLEEAAQGLGASAATTFRRVVLPLSLPGIIAGSLLVFAMSMESFTTPGMVGGQRLPIISLLIQQQVVTLFNYPLGATLASILLLLVMFIVYLTTLISTGKAGTDER